MRARLLFNDNALNTNFKELLYQYDKDKNGFSKQEWSQALRKITNIFGKNAIKITGYDKKIFKTMDENKDSILSYDEFAKYVKNEYKLDFNSFYDMNLSEVCDVIDSASKNQED